MDLDREYKLYGPRDGKVSLAAVAELLGYADAESIKDLAAEGRLPKPKGIGAAQYYSGLDVAVILDYFGRWMPLTPGKVAGGKSGEIGAKKGKSGEAGAEQES